MHDEDMERRYHEFERAWKPGIVQELAQFLDRAPRLNAEARRRWLIEIACIDLEYTWRGQAGIPGQGGPMRAEDYAAYFPELGPVDRVSLELIGQEYRVRCEAGDRPIRSEFLTRFPDRQEEIQAALDRIDVELVEEACPPRVGPVRRPAVEITPPPGIPLLSSGEFRLRRMIGSGATGKVYAAWQPGASRSVAVKYLRKSVLDHPEVVSRFVAEAGIIASLKHPGIVQLHGLGHTTTGAFFLVMELVTGSSLDHILVKGQIPLDKVIRWTMLACEALEHAHSQGVIHCDLKPANLLLDPAGTIRLTDFGLARSLQNPSTGTFEVEGTPPFMAPEQASRCWGRVDERTDVYGLGAVLFTLLTGRPPWMGERLTDVLSRLVSAAAVISPQKIRRDLPTSLDAICRRCLCKPPEGRYPSIRDVRLALQEIVESGSLRGS